MATDREVVMCLASDKENMGMPPEYNGMGETEDPYCGDMMNIYIHVNSRQIIDGCGYTLNEGACMPVTASAVAAVKLMLNRPVMSAYTITSNEIAAFFTDNGIPDKEHVHCILMAELTLKKAIIDYLKNQESFRNHRTGCT